MPMVGVPTAYPAAVPEPTHVLVIQFPQSAFPEFDDLVHYEDTLIELLGGAHDVDGHDSGSGEVNFFVLTNEPGAAMTAMRDARHGFLLSHPQVRLAARLVDGEDYEPLWPVGDKREFGVA
jgi:hypothetical protein